MSNIPTAHILRYPLLHSNIQTITTPSMAYVLGLLWADGHLEQAKTGRLRKLSLTLVKEDFEAIRSIIQETGEWIIKPKMVKNSDRNNRECVIAYTCSTVILKCFWDLDYHIKSGLAPTKVLSVIPDHLKHYWWRGYFDGDGCLCKRLRAFSWTITSTADQDWTTVQRLGEALGVIFSIDRGSGRYSQIRLTRRLWIYAFMDYIYQGESFGLERKRCKYQQMKDEERELNKRHSRPMRWISTQRWKSGIGYRFQFRKDKVMLCRSPVVSSIEEAMMHRQRFFASYPHLLPQNAKELQLSNPLRNLPQND